MKYTLALSLLLAALPAAAKGGPDKVTPGKEPDPKEMAAKMVGHMTQGLDLTEDQKKKVEGILEQSMPERMELEKKVHKLEWSTDEKIRALLTDEQKERFDRWRLMKGHHPGMGRQGPPMGPPGQAGQPGGPGQPGQPGEMDGGPKAGQPPPPPSGAGQDGRSPNGQPVPDTESY